MTSYWPAGTEEAVKVRIIYILILYNAESPVLKRLNTFFHEKTTDSPGFCPSSDKEAGSGTNSRIKTYADGRNRADIYNTSRIRFASHLEKSGTQLITC